MNLRWKRFLAAAVASTQLVSSVAAHSSGPGTCNIDEMARIGHGFSLQPACPNCFSVFVHANTNLTSPSRYVVTLSSAVYPTFRGLLLYVQNAGNQTFGNFTEYDHSLFGPVECEDAVEFDVPSTVGQIDGRDKTWPVTFGWSPGEVVVNGEDGNLVEGDIVTLKGIALISYANYHIIPPFSFTLQQSNADFLDISSLRRIQLLVESRSESTSASTSKTTSASALKTSPTSKATPKTTLVATPIPTSTPTSILASTPTSILASTPTSILTSTLTSIPTPTPTSTPIPISTPVTTLTGSSFRDNALFLVVVIFILAFYSAGNYALFRIKRLDRERRNNRNKMKGTSPWGPAVLAAGVAGMPPAVDGEPTEGAVGVEFMGGPSDEKKVT